MIWVRFVIYGLSAVSALIRTIPSKEKSPNLAAFVPLFFKPGHDEVISRSSALPITWVGLLEPRAMADLPAFALTLVLRKLVPGT